MLGGRTGAAVGFFNEEGVAVTANRPAYHVFRLDRFGSPAYPELVLVAARKTVNTRPKMVEGVVKAFSDGTATAVSHPAVAAAAVRNRIGAADPKLFTKRLAAALSALLPPSGKAGSLDPAVLAQWAGWEVAHGLVSRRPNVQAMFDTRFAG